MRMTKSKSKKSSIRNQDFIHLKILLGIAFVLGTYLIVTTVLVSKDGIHYIERAQEFPENPFGHNKREAFGYPLLIFATHKLVTLFSGGFSSGPMWIYSAQSITLLCRLIAIIPLYFMGKLLVGSRRSFWAILILIVLPYPAEYGSDILRDWPHLMFLAMSFLFILKGAEEYKCFMFGLAGLAAGLGYIIRPECAQIVLYGTLWILIRLIIPFQDMNRPKSLWCFSLLLLGFAIPAVPYINATGNIAPEKLKDLFSYNHQSRPEEFHAPKNDNEDNIYTASSVPVRLAQATGKLTGEISNNLMHFFMPAMVIGIYFHFRRKSETTKIERFFIPVFVLLNFAMMIFLHYKWQYISRRHCLPLTAILIFYVPGGLEIIGTWLQGKFPKNSLQTGSNTPLYFFILLAIGITVCMPKLLRPIRIEKQGYRAAANWLNKNTASGDLIAVPDNRIIFYANRKGLVYLGKPPKLIKYAVLILEKDQKADFAEAAKEEFSVPENQRKKDDKKIVIYKMNR